MVLGKNSFNCFISELDFSGVEGLPFRVAENLLEPATESLVMRLPQDCSSMWPEALGAAPMWSCATKTAQNKLPKDPPLPTPAARCWQLNNDSLAVGKYHDVSVV